MKKIGKDSGRYTLEIPYANDNELEEIIDDLMSEAHEIADGRYGFIEMLIQEQLTGKSWG